MILSCRFNLPYSTSLCGHITIAWCIVFVSTFFLNMEMEEVVRNEIKISICLTAMKGSNCKKGWTNTLAPDKIGSR